MNGLAQKVCTTTCDLFRCAKHALTSHGGTPWCRLTNEGCNPGDCGYAMCAKRRLLPNGICGLTIKRRTSEEVKPEEFMKEAIRVKGKLLKRMHDKEIF